MSTEAMADSTVYGEFSEELNTEIDGKIQHVRIYHRYVDETWSEFTVVLDDGSVLLRNRCLTHPSLFGREAESV